MLVFFCMLLLGLSVACMRKNKVLVPIPPRWRDLNYIDQVTRISTCLKDLPGPVYNNHEPLQRYWLQQAHKKILETMNDIDAEQFINGKYIDCLAEVCQHEINKFLCPSHKLNVGVFDAIEYYSKLEHEQCVKEKNIQNKESLAFDIPDIVLEGKNVMESDVEVML